MEALDLAGFVRGAGAVALLPRRWWATSGSKALPAPLGEPPRRRDDRRAYEPGLRPRARCSTTRASTPPAARRRLLRERGDVAEDDRLVAAARRSGSRARGGGHSYGGYSAVPGGVVVDVSRMTASRSARPEQATVGAGAKLIDVYAGLSQHGVAIPAGSCATVGIGGLTLGGGIGFLSRKLGTTCDNLVGLDARHSRRAGARLLGARERRPLLGVPRRRRRQLRHRHRVPRSGRQPIAS